jgi:hypothetical protein
VTLSVKGLQPGAVRAFGQRIDGCGLEGKVVAKIKQPLRRAETGRDDHKRKQHDSHEHLPPRPVIRAR